jgi:hypothetical protein
LPGVKGGVSDTAMTETKKGGRGASPKAKPGAHRQSQMPGWTNGLRQLYDQVVDEELPDSFRDLLARLDKAD